MPKAKKSDRSFELSFHPARSFPTSKLHNPTSYAKPGPLQGIIGMGSINETIDSWVAAQILPETASLFKEWLTAPQRGWKLEDPPDAAFFELKEEDLIAANFQALRQRRLILANLSQQKRKRSASLDTAQT
ncbi:hypothetical protein COCOBI_11-5650 [Coccomyxa sp. Obi]|nr:hypothetical protein COCOBI_11-5650 [Coccomyxa sp. Obi]